jgi:hypothetical protein
MKTKQIVAVVAGIAALGAVGFMPWSHEQGLVVHEWGTFTSLQGSDGVPLKWNPLASSQLPGFVYNWRRAGLGRHPTGMLALGPKSGLSTLQRLETPVIYFYSEHEQTANVTVRFPKGGITEWYPQATTIGPSAVGPSPMVEKLDSGLHALGVSPTFSLESLDPIGTVSESVIEWDGLKIVPTDRAEKLSALPKDSSGSHYFTARDTDAAYVQLPGSAQGDSAPELEKFLFYRGVGDFATPLIVSMESDNRVSLFNNGTQPIAHLFILSINDKTGSLVSFDALKPNSNSEVTFLPAEQAQPLDMLQTNITTVMERALVAEGLFEREAVAMVNTWKDSWFTENGVRVLYLLPRAWTDEVLPMTIKPAPKLLVRVMVGRAELITPGMEYELAAVAAKAKGNREAAEQELRPLAKQLGRFAEPAWNWALARAK